MFDFSFFDKGVERKGTNSIKWDGIDENLLPFWIADMDFESPPAVREALVKRAEYPVYAYTLRYDNAPLVDYLKNRHDISVNKDEIQLAPNVVSAIRVCVNTFSQKGDRIAVFTPVYGPFFLSVLTNKRELVDIPLLKDENNRYDIDFEHFEEELKKGLKMLIFCNPHNPVSRMWSKKELEKIMALCRKYDCFLVTDEIHADFVFDDKFVSLFNFSNKEDKFVMLYAANKTFNLAGLFQGYMISKNTELLSKAECFMGQNGVESGNIFAMEANQAAFKYGSEWLDGLIEYLKANRDFMIESFKKLLPELKISPVEATYLAWLDFNYLGLTSKELDEKLIKGGVKLNQGSMFGKGGEGFVRLNFACKRSLLKEGIEKIAAALK